jgi:hypothetical protein
MAMTPTRTFPAMTIGLARRLVAGLVLMLGACWLGAAEYPAQNTVDIFRARVQAARLLSLPKPPAGVRDVRWSDLSPADWHPGAFLNGLDFGTKGDTDPLAMHAREQVRQLWDTAPAVPLADDGPVRLTGFPLRLEGRPGASGTIVLVPYDGAGTHHAAPPANQMVLVALKSALPRNLDGYPIWITGRIYAVRSSTQYGNAAYTMTDASWSKYPYEKFPLPPYSPPR